MWWLGGSFGHSLGSYWTLSGLSYGFGGHFGSFWGSLLGGLGGFWSIFGLQFDIICSFQDSTQNLLNFGCVLGYIAPSKMCVLYVRGLENHVSGRSGLGVLFESILGGFGSYLEALEHPWEELGGSPGPCWAG